MNIFIISPHLGKDWLQIQKNFIEKNTKEKYKYCVYNVPQTQDHLKSLHMCLEVIRREKPMTGDLIIEMDSDAFPIKDNWISKIKTYLVDERYEFVAVQRIESPNRFTRQIPHPCFCAWRYGTEIKWKWTARNPYVINWETRKWKKLHRTNKVNLHRQLYAVYNNMIWHQGAGSRNVDRQSFFKDGLKYRKKFWENPDKFIKSLI